VKPIRLPGAATPGAPKPDSQGQFNSAVGHSLTVQTRSSSRRMRACHEEARIRNQSRIRNLLDLCRHEKSGSDEYRCIRRPNESNGGRAVELVPTTRRRPQDCNRILPHIADSDIAIGGRRYHGLGPVFHPARGVGRAHPPVATATSHGLPVSRSLRHALDHDCLWDESLQQEGAPGVGQPRQDDLGQRREG